MIRRHGSAGCDKLIIVVAADVWSCAWSKTCRDSIIGTDAGTVAVLSETLVYWAIIKARVTLRLILVMSHSMKRSTWWSKIQISVTVLFHMYSWCAIPKVAVTENRFLLSSFVKFWQLFTFQRTNTFIFSTILARFRRHGNQLITSAGTILIILCIPHGSFFKWMQILFVLCSTLKTP